jgi:iron(III) transport system permease protein
MGRALILALRRHEQELALLAVGVILFFTVALPLAAPALSMGSSSGEAWSRALRDFTSGGRLLLLLWRSTWLSSAVTGAAVMLGVPFGLVLGRTNIVGRRALALALPVSLPPFLLVLGWYHLWGRSGWLGSETSSAWLFSDGGVVIVLSLAFVPVVIALTALGVRAVHPSIEEAARVVAGPMRTVTSILLPAIWPSVALAALIVFAMAFSELGVPMFLRRDVYPAAVFARLGGIDFQPGEALALSLPLLPVAGALVAVERMIFRGRSFAVLGASRTSALPIPLGGAQLPLSVGCWTIAMLTLVPIGALVAKAGLAGVGGAGRKMGMSVINSLVTSLIAAGAIAALASVLGHGIARRSRGASWLDGVSMLAFLTPAAVLGTGIMSVYNRPLTSWLYGSLAIIVLGFTARYSVVGVRTMAVAVAQASPSFEDSARSFGARYGRRLVAIVLPMHRRAVIGAGLLAFIFCLRDLETAVLFYPPGGEPLTVRIFTLEANGPPPIVAGLAVVHAVMTLVALAIGSTLFHKRARA